MLNCQVCALIPKQGVKSKLPDASGSYTPMEKQSGYRKKASLDRGFGIVGVWGLGMFRVYIGRVSFMLGAHMALRRGLSLIPPLRTWGFGLPRAC